MDELEKRASGIKGLQRITFRATVEDREYQTNGGPILPGTPYTKTLSKCEVTLAVDERGGVKVEDVTPTSEQLAEWRERGWNS